MRASILPAVVLLSACAGQPAPAEHWTRWVCDSQAEVLWRAVGEDAVDLRLGGDDIVHRLQREPSGSGALYSDGVLAFHSKGEEGLVYRVADDDLIGRGCKVR
ncbi:MULTISPECIES: MliC family protein [unclassified Pseudomonas]|uniref:MliC family protein n=1 Tax=unclassified Pseudomonas TaxID=196821 RepID=UPI00244A2505|nr:MULTISPECIES: MliC family protein [unclassified Pseudomonas]MDH0895901.1 MliC family protein [Pseudomonas sp. GD03875]MDH1065312.1 MliC family protein [Pseudomonas sp. GD03985]